MVITAEKWVTTSEWVKTSELAQRLHITPTTLLRWKAKYTKDGTWIEGTHWVSTGLVKSSHILFNAQEVMKTFVDFRAPSEGGNQ